MITYCKNCVMPDTKPDLHIDGEGICNACRSFMNRPKVDWAKRREELETILARYRKNGTYWDCICPVSGGKDSTYIVKRMLDFGMTPLCVTSTTCDMTEIGRKNIEVIKNMGVDYIQFSPNPNVRKKLNKIGLLQVGDISWPEHVGIFTIPVRAATQYNIPLLVWGENSQNEYGGPAAASEKNVLDRRWLEEFGGMLGLRVSDLNGLEGICEKDLISYTYPTDAELQRVGVTGLFLGHYIPWDGFSNVLISQSYGLNTWHTAIEGSSVDYENLDNYQTGIHDYFKFLKFGFGRASDLVSMHIRRGRLTRADGMDIVRRLDGQFPATYLDKPLDKILERIDVTVEQFISLCDRFTNKKLFLKDAKGNLIKDRKGNLTKINYDNDESTQTQKSSPDRLRNGESGVLKTVS